MTSAPSLEDAQALRALVAELYASVSAPAGVAPPIARETPLLHPQARKCRTRHRPDGEVTFQIMSGEAYGRNVVGLATAPGFFEVEVDHEAFVYGNIAHVLSHYEAFADESRTQRVKKGVNSIQLLKVDGRWKVFSMIWDDEENRLNMEQSNAQAD